MFIDIAKIKIVSGKGGDGKVGFHREKYVAAGGPDGGDGGRGGSVIFKVDDNLSTLLDFRYKKKYVAAPGEPGGGKRCKGKDGADLIIRVPRGTIIRDQKTGQVMKDMSDSEPFVAAKGGNGGWGNTHFATPTRQAPRFAKPGLPGVERDIILELKLLADVGLVGFPNVGKSTLLSMVSAARPKIANYHFTTLVPNLGVVSVGEEQNFVMADIPGIIEGASEGAGLGHDFLLNSNENIDLLHKRFIVFEIDAVKDNAELFPVVTIIIMEAFINKLRRLKGVRKMLICEEAWKALSSPSMSEYLKYMYKTVRKYFGEAIVVTQEVDDIISSPIVKEAIITNSDCKILLDQKKYSSTASSRCSG